jgi:hypothetical protein
VAIERLTAGQSFHKTVQSAFLTGLAGASGFAERQWRLIQGGRGRVDLAVEVDGDEQMLVVIEPSPRAGVTRDRRATRYMEQLFIILGLTSDLETAVSTLRPAATARSS